MKRLLTIIGTVLITQSCFAYDATKPIWQQIESLRCEKVLKVFCFVEHRPDGRGRNAESPCSYQETFSDNRKFAEFNFRDAEFSFDAGTQKLTRKLSAFNFESVNENFGINTMMLNAQQPVEFFRTELGLFKVKHYYSLTTPDGFFQTTHEEYLCVEN